MRNLFSPNWSLFDGMDRELNRFVRTAPQNGQLNESWQPEVDILEDKSRYLLVADVPGVNPEKIDISMEDNILTIRGKRETVNDEQEQTVRRGERRFGEFKRSFLLPETVDVEGISAKGGMGVLEVAIPKKAAVQPRRIPVTH